MKKVTLLVIIVILFSLMLNSCGIIRYSSRNGLNDMKDEKYYSEKRFTREEVYALKSTKTVFFTIEEDEEFEQIINDAWNFTELEFVPYEMREDYINKEGCSYFSIEVQTVKSVEKRLGEPNYRREVYENSHFFLTLSLPMEKRNNKYGSINFCRIELFPVGQLLNSSDKSLFKSYREGNIKNWDAVLLSLYLSEVQKNLKKGKRIFLYDTYFDENALSKLKKDTLFIRKHILEKYDPLTGKETEEHIPQELFNDYKYPYKFISLEELKNKIDRNQDLFLLDYVKSSTDKFISIYHTRYGRIYQDYRGVSYNIKSKDIKRIAKRVIKFE